MIYPNNFEQKIGFDEIRQLLKDRCLSPMGKERIDSLRFSTDVKSIRQWLEQIKEFRRIINSGEEFPTQFYYDVRAGVSVWRAPIWTRESYSTFAAFSTPWVKWSAT